MPVFILGSTLTSITQSAASAHRVFEVIDAPIDVADKADAIALTHLHGRVVFEDVSFRYAGSEIMTRPTSPSSLNQARQWQSWEKLVRANLLSSI